MANLILPEEQIVGIQTAEQMAKLAHDLRVRPDWHEPDEQGVNARIIGTHLDNAMGSTTRPLPSDDPSNPHGEFNVVITRGGEDVAVINLASLLAWAATAFPIELRTWKA
jgi:hypothetical protein